MSPPKDDVYGNTVKIRNKIRGLGEVAVRKVYYHLLALSMEKWAV
jgi:hypothetical protein